MKRRNQTEDSILNKIIGATRNPQKNLAAFSVSLGMGDDAALLRPKTGHQTILTCDWFLEGTHFLRDKHPPDAVGWKCLARAVSDIAAMGGVPRCFLLSLALPETHTRRWLEQFLGGLRRAARKFECVLAGGDTTRRNEILINVTVAGEIPAGRAALRSGARAGDIIYVSGRLGEAELGLRLLKRSKGPADRNNPLIKKHLYPEPRLALGRWLASKGLVTAMMDLSDGLSSDLLRLCRASGVGARIELASLPIAEIQGHSLDAAELALEGGDDYEMLFTVPGAKAARVPGSLGGVKLTPIGRITGEPQGRVLRQDGRTERLKAGGWDPFHQ